MIDLTGQKFNRLIAVRATDGRGSDGLVIWLWLCDCGSETFASSNNVKRGNTRSCGCFAREQSRRTIQALHKAKHGMHGSPTYNSWHAMLQRCENPRNLGYKNYGGRGVTVCARWKCFGLFLADMGVRPAGYSIERINNCKGYSPANCKWASRAEQHQNQRHNNQYTAGRL